MVCHDRGGVAAVLAALALVGAGCRSTAPTPTPVPRPTYVAPAAAPPLALAVVDGPHLAADQAPEPSAGAPCGVVDRLDTPLGPPDGDGFAVRWVFGRFSRRYNGIHTGEDWVSLTGASLGTPVHAVGHGQVTYAQPYGWGQTDKGVVIVRHVMPDGTRRLSLYGHLQPESVTLKAGACVGRGDVVGLIGKPRASPHLHFELRTFLPDAPGPGYWPTDPDRAGWLNPSEAMWRLRLAQHPAVRWTTPATATHQSVAGILPGGLIVAEDDGDLVGLDPQGDGKAVWRAPADGAGWVADEAAPVLYGVTTEGLVARRVGPDGVSDADWTRPGFTSAAELYPWPAGGVAVAEGGRLTAFGADGSSWWERDVPRPDHVAAVGDGLALAGDDLDPETRFVDRAGTVRGPVPVGGIPVVTTAGILVLLRPSGLYEVDPASLAARRLVRWTDGTTLRAGSLAALEGGDVLVLRRTASWSLSRIRPDGAEAWRRTLPTSGVSADLMTTGHGVYLTTGAGDVLAVDTAGASATRIFRLAGTPDARAWVAGGSAAEDLALVSSANGLLVAVDLAKGRTTLGAAGSMPGGAASPAARARP